MEIHFLAKIQPEKVPPLRIVSDEVPKASMGTSVNTNLFYKEQYHCTADILFDWFSK